MGATVTAYVGTGGNVTIPSTVNYDGAMRPVIKIEKNAFANQTNITSISIPTSVNTVADEAFFNCDGITSLVLPSSITSVSANCFYDCDSLTSVRFTSSTQVIGDYAFYSCDNLTTITGYTRVEKFGNYSFADCHKLEILQIKTRLLEIGKNAFQNCTGLTSWDYTDSSLKTIDDNAFYGCTGLTTFVGTSKIEKIGNSAFYGCTSLMVVYLNEIDVANHSIVIGKKAFMNDSSLQNVVLPNSIEQVNLTKYKFEYSTENNSWYHIYVQDDAFKNTPYYNREHTKTTETIIQNRGTGKKCVGNQQIVPIFINTTVSNYNSQTNQTVTEISSWNNLKIQEKLNELNLAKNTIINKSIKYGIDLSFYSPQSYTNTNDYLVLNYQGMSAYDGVLNPSFADTIRMVLDNHNFNEEAYDGTIYLVFVDYNGRSQACCCIDTQDVALYGVPTSYTANGYNMYENAVIITHEIMHLYGAVDLYNESNSMNISICEYAKFKYSRDIMQNYYYFNNFNTTTEETFSETYEISAFTAQIIGWTNVQFDSDFFLLQIIKVYNSDGSITYSNISSNPCEAGNQYYTYTNGKYHLI